MKKIKMSIAKVCKFQKERKEVSLDCGETWQRTSVTRKISGREPVERNSHDCGFQVSRRTVNSGYTCNGYDKYTQLVDEVSYDGETTWSVVSGSSRLGTFVERFSSDCCQLRTSSATVCTELFQYAIADIEEASLDGETWIPTGRYTITQMLDEVDWDCLNANNVKFLGVPTSGSSGLSFFNYNNYTNVSTSFATAVGREGGFVIFGCDADNRFRVTNKIIDSSSTDGEWDNNGELLTIENMKYIYVGDCAVNPILARALDENGTIGQPPIYTSLEKIFISSGASGSLGQILESGGYIGNSNGIKDAPNLTEIVGLGNSQITAIGFHEFEGCTSLKTLHIPSTCQKIDYYAFADCTSLSSVTFDTKCMTYDYQGINECPTDQFNGCTSLKTITFPNDYYGVINKSMFVGCSALTAVTLGNPTDIRDRAFYNCSSLSSITLGDSVSYIGQNAFAGCTSLKDVYIGQTQNILSNVYNNTFPSGCTIHVPCEAYDYWHQVYEIDHPELGVSISCTQNIFGYLAFTATESGTFKFNGNSINYSLDSGATWTALASDTNSPTVNAGDKIMWKATLTPTSSGIGTFSSTNKFTVEGNIMSLLYGDNFSGQTSVSDNTFKSLFNGCTHLTSAENLELPATSLGWWCYESMFYWCINLSVAPQLPATNLSGARGCYAYMFYSTPLTVAPQLPATTLDTYCYQNMFEGCLFLTTAPSLPATTLASGCYQQMFNGCSNLTVAPQLPATTLASGCYAGMFAYCSSLTTAPSLPATTLTSSCYSDMFYNCTSLTTAPQLPATTLTDWCYRQMFQNCTSLNSITCLATDISASSCTFNWANGVAASGTFTKAASMSSWTTSTSGIPSGWTVSNA